MHFRKATLLLAFLLAGPLPQPRPNTLSLPAQTTQRRRLQDLLLAFSLGGGSL